jgi:hypothetical protein
VPGTAALSWSETVTEPTIIGHLGDTPTQHTEYDVGIAPTLTEDANNLLELIQAIFLGVVQGLTEFLPVSSSGHLLLAQYFLGVNEERFGLAFDASIHTGTLLAVVWFFRRDLLRMSRAFLSSLGGLDLTEPNQRMVYLVLASTIPAGGWPPRQWEGRERSAGKGRSRRSRRASSRFWIS